MTSLTIPTVQHIQQVISQEVIKQRHAPVNALMIEKMAQSIKNNLETLTCKSQLDGKGQSYRTSRKKTQFPYKLQFTVEPGAFSTVELIPGKHDKKALIVSKSSGKVFSEICFQVMQNGTIKTLNIVIHRDLKQYPGHAERCRKEQAMHSIIFKFLEGKGIVNPPEFRLCPSQKDGSLKPELVQTRYAGTLKSVMDRDYGEILLLFPYMLSRLQKLHDRGILHIDLIRENIFLNSCTLPTEALMADWETACQTGVYYGSNVKHWDPIARNLHIVTPLTDLHSILVIIGAYCAKSSFCDYVEFIYRTPLLNFKVLPLLLSQEIAQDPTKRALLDLVVEQLSAIHELYTYLNSNHFGAGSALYLLECDDYADRLSTYQNLLTQFPKILTVEALGNRLAEILKDRVPCSKPDLVIKKENKELVSVPFKPISLPKHVDLVIFLKGELKKHYYLIVGNEQIDVTADCILTHIRALQENPDINPIAHRIKRISGDYPFKTHLTFDAKNESVIVELIPIRSLKAALIFPEQWMDYYYELCFEIHKDGQMRALARDISRNPEPTIRDQEYWLESINAQRSVYALLKGKNITDPKLYREYTSVKGKINIEITGVRYASTLKKLSNLDYVHPLSLLAGTLSSLQMLHDNHILHLNLTSDTIYTLFNNSEALMLNTGQNNKIQINMSGENDSYWDFLARRLGVTTPLTDLHSILTVIGNISIEKNFHDYVDKVYKEPNLSFDDLPPLFSKVTHSDPIKKALLKMLVEQLSAIHDIYQYFSTHQKNEKARVRLINLLQGTDQERYHAYKRLLKKFPKILTAEALKGRLEDILKA